MKTYFKRISALLIAVAMTLAMCTTAFAKTPGADGKYGTEDDRGTITVSGVDTADTSVKAIAYQIIKANYDNGGEFSGYESLYPDIITFNDQNEVVYDEAKLSQIIQGNKVDGTMFPMELNGGTFTAEVPVGSYVVGIYDSETKIYSPVVVSVYYENTGTGNDVAEGTVNVNEDQANAWVKVRDLPELTKVITDVRDLDGNEKGNTADYGDTVSYKLTTTAPYYGGSFPTFKITDTMTNVTYVEDSLKVYAGKDLLTAGTDYTFTWITKGNSIFEINFVVNNQYTLNDKQGQTITVEYQATLDNTAELNEGNLNKNEAVLTFAKDSLQENNLGEDDDNVVYTHTFDLNNLLKKVNKDHEALAGAEFTLYTDDECKETYTNTGFEGVATTDADGTLNEIKGLAAGTYYLKETKAPEGYALVNTVYTIEIAATADAEGKLTDHTVTVSGASIEGGSVIITLPGGNVTPVEIINTKLSELPSTGGIGTYIFTIAGVVIMAAAAGLFFVKRRRDAE